MRALVYTGTQELVYREEKNPKIVNNESIVKVSASGICGSDMHTYHGKYTMDLALRQKLFC